MPNTTENKPAKKGKKVSGKPSARNLMDNYLDSPANHTRSASGKNTSNNMATQSERNLLQHAHEAIPEEQPMQPKQNATNTINNNASSMDKEGTQINQLSNLNSGVKAKEGMGFVAQQVNQINNSPANSPVKATSCLQKEKGMNHVLQSQSDHTGNNMPNQTRDETNDEQNSSPSMINMLVELNKTMKGLQGQLSRMHTVQEEHTFKVSTLEFVQKDEVQYMRQVQSKLEKQEQMIEMLINHVSKQDERIAELTSKQNDFQARSMRKNIVITGIKENGHNENCEELATKFMQEQLNLPKAIDIKVAHRVGTGQI